jgi:DNA-directed RNA polymerase alpha subunit
MFGMNQINGSGRRNVENHQSWKTVGVLINRSDSTMLDICNFGQSFTRKYKKTHIHHYRSPRKLKTQEEKSAPQEK